MIPALLVPSVRPRALLRGAVKGRPGDTTQLTLRQYLIGGGFDDSGTGVTWSSSNTAVATVNGSGLVTIVSVVGSATITATAVGLPYTAQVPATEVQYLRALTVGSDAAIIGLYSVRGGLTTSVTSEIDYLRAGTASGDSALLGVYSVRGGLTTV